MRWAWEAAGFTVRGKVFERPEAKELLKSLGVEGEYEGIGNCILGYVDGEEPEAAPRKENWVYHID